ncbi:MAG TPA: hypothetical protein VMU93_00110 [Caulobacteraceae bacterium]|nr:hypothetical protein [Caulobacteraceae bacterium]
MSAETMTDAVEEAAEAKASARSAARAALDTGQRSFADALGLAERSLNDASRRVEKALREGVEALKVQTQSYRDSAGEQFDEAQRYVVARVKERPVTATLAGLGVGLLLGLLLANRSGK